MQFYYMYSSFKNHCESLKSAICLTILRNSAIASAPLISGNRDTKSLEVALPPLSAKNCRICSIRIWAFEGDRPGVGTGLLRSDLGVPSKAWRCRIRESNESLLTPLPFATFEEPNLGGPPDRPVHVGVPSSFRRVCRRDSRRASAASLATLDASFSTNIVSGLEASMIESCSKAE